MSDRLTCDNQPRCKESLPWQATQEATYARARARGWRVWSGTTMSGDQAQMRLCPRCVGKHARGERVPPGRPMPGQQELPIA
jgi:hypothetical protein